MTTVSTGELLPAFARIVQKMPRGGPGLSSVRPASDSSHKICKEAVVLKQKFDLFFILKQGDFSYIWHATIMTGKS
jgi:hypothetical protein